MTDYDDFFTAEFDAEQHDMWTDAEADADTLASAGMGTDEDYGYYGAEDAAMEYAWGDC